MCGSATAFQVPPSMHCDITSRPTSPQVNSNFDSRGRHGLQIPCAQRLESGRGCAVCHSRFMSDSRGNAVTTCFAPTPRPGKRHRKVGRTYPIQLAYGAMHFLFLRPKCIIKPACCFFSCITICDGIQKPAQLPIIRSSPPYRH